ncbi:DctP family TRAP transporter solute-binding subunit [Salirhabdus salicampi]|uniref:DctP family TRAP transporter solute-binding subunit n=1 Tax=Salirhabdus salicampi TaxID=476102 RepID=UPI0020C2A197|nr:DctP family TRAP transporter solute-binding subunit [Salirhabdus salicampi]MCP8615622.1 DctP family TRAP transporter solute-binding subunit [Salirhabdus salicampi]
MKNYLWIVGFVFIGLITAFYFGFHFIPYKQSSLEHDDEQMGIKDQIIIKFSHVVAENTPKGIAAQRFAQLVEENSDYRIKVEVYPNGMLYSDEDELDALIEGNVQMISPAHSKLEKLSPDWLVLDIPFAFPTYDAVSEAYEGKIGQELFSMLEKKNIKGLGFWYNGFKQMTSNDPLIHPADFREKVFRIMPSDVIEMQFHAFGAEAVPIPFNKTYQSLEKGEIDGQENTISNIYSKKFYEVQENLTISNHGYLGYVVLINNDFWKSLSPDIQAIIKEAMEETSDWMKELAKTINDQELDKIKENSDINIHYLTLEEKNLWLEELSSFYNSLDKKIRSDLVNEAWKIHDKYLE